jgi:hypothetical protein
VSRRERKAYNQKMVDVTNLTSTMFIGDPKHMPPMVNADHINEYRSSTAVAGLTILVDKGNKLWRVNEQHRIHPSMSPFPDKESYGGTLTNASHTPNDSEIRPLFREAFLERYQIELSKKEDGKGSQCIAVEVPKGVGFTKNGSTVVGWSPHPCHGNQLPYLVRGPYQNLLHPT